MVQLWRSFGYLIPLVATVGAVVLVVTAVASWGVNGSVRSRAAVGSAVLDGPIGVWVLGLVAVTLNPESSVAMPGEGLPVDLVPFHDIVTTARDAVSWEVPFVQVVGNLVLVASGGVLLGLRSGWGWGTSALRFLVLGVVVESLQLLVAGRTAVVDDVMLAVGGGVLGCAAGRAMRRHRVPAEVAEASVA